MALASDFDAFLSYHSRDQERADELVKLLHERGIRTWNDANQLPPGTAGYRQKIEAAIERASCVIIAVGPAGPGPWQQFEVDLSVQQSVSRSLKIVPLLLPGGGLAQLPPLLTSRFSISDFSLGFNNAKALDRLVWGVTGELTWEACARVPMVGRDVDLKSPDSAEPIDAFAVSNVKADVYKAAEVTATYATAVVTAADELGQHDLTRWILLLVGLRWQRAYLTAFDQLLRVRRTERSLRDYQLSLVCSDSDDLDGVLSASKGNGEIVIALDGTPVGRIEGTNSDDQVLVERAINQYGRLGRPLAGSRSLRDRLADVPVATVEHEDNAVATVLHKNRETLAVLAARFGMPGQDRVLAERPQPVHERQGLSFRRSEEESSVPMHTVVLSARRFVALGESDGISFDQYSKTIQETPDAVEAIRTLFGDGPEGLRRSWEFQKTFQAGRGPRGS